MTRFSAELSAALTYAFSLLRDPRRMNPAWLPHLDSSQLAPTDLEPPELHLVQRALVAPVVAALGVTSDGEQEELRIAIDADGAILMTRGNGGTADWMGAPVAEITDYVRELLPFPSRLSASPQMTARGGHNALRLTSEQRRSIAQRVTEGVPAREAIAAQHDLDASLRDALLTDGDRATFDITMYIPPVEDAPVLRFHLLRRWTAGHQGLYSADGEEGFSESIHQVADGDLLGTVLPLLDEGAALARGEGAAA